MNYPSGVTQDSFDRAMEGLGYDPAEEEESVFEAWEALDELEQSGDVEF